MVKKRPTILVIMGILLGMLALAGPLQIIIFEYDGWNPAVVISELTFFQWLVLILGLAASVTVLEASQWVRVFLPTLTFVVLGHQLLHWHHHEVSSLSMSMAAMGFVALNVPLIHPNVLSLINYPERRWWRSSRRKRAELPIYLGGCLKGEVRSLTFEISETGAFVTFPPGPPPKFKVDEKVSICVTLGVLNQVRCVGRVVRVVEPRGSYPRGVAVEFEGLPWGSKRELKRFISSR